MLASFSRYLVFELLALPENQWSLALEFFIYDSIKIIFLLLVMISVIGFFRSYISQQDIQKWLSGKHPLLGNIAASFFGAMTPFCSCSSVPIFLSFVKAGVPLGTAFSFLITSPLINEYLVILMLGFFGLKITILYVISGIILGIISGSLIGKLKLGNLIDKKYKTITKPKHKKFKNIQSRIIFGLNEARDIVFSIWPWVLFGVGVGALIHNFVPQTTIQMLVNIGGIFSVPLAVLAGIPMYGSCAAIVPIAVVLFQKGVPLGTALAFMMAVSALSLPEAIILRRAMKLKMLGIFFGIVALGIIILGYLMNFLASHQQIFNLH